MPTRDEAGLFPALLRHWRSRRGLSQLDLALAADVSPRHVSFLETGRAQPSREMVLRLGATLDVPLRDQNALLDAAGFAREFAEPSFADGLPDAISRTIDRMLAQQEPFPMVAMNRRYDVLRTNQAAARLLSTMIAQPEAVVPESFRQPDFSQPSEPILTIRLRAGDLDLAFLTTVTVFNAPQNVTLEEVRLESYFPLDEATTRACEQLAQTG